MPTNRGEVCQQTQRCLDALVRYSTNQGLLVGLDKPYGALININRIRSAQKAIDAKAKYLLFVDSDMVFAEDALMRLLALDRDIVSGLCTSRIAPYRPVIKKRNAEGVWKMVEGLEDGRFRSDVGGVGCAFLLVKTIVFEKIEKPWFAMPPIDLEDDYIRLKEKVWLATSPGVVTLEEVQELLTVEMKHHDATTNRETMGEDFYFCIKAKRAGYDICVDASLVIGHIGEQAYCIDDYLVAMEQIEKEKQEKASSAA